MMIRTAGGPSLVSPIDYGERKRPISKATWIVIAVVGLAHVGVGVALYNQRFELTGEEALPDLPPSVTVTMTRPKPPPLPTTDIPPAPNPPIHRTAPNPIPAPDPLVAVIPEIPATATGNALNFTTEVAPDSTGTVATPEPPRPPAVITRPDWLSRPSAAQMGRAYPDRALEQGTGGAATLRCNVRVDGGLSGCAVASETPSRLGFGRAALGLTQYFRMSPRTVDGQAVDGAAVVFVVRFGVTD